MSGGGTGLMSGGGLSIGSGGRGMAAGCSSMLLSVCNNSAARALRYTAMSAASTAVFDCAHSTLKISKHAVTPKRVEKCTTRTVTNRSRRTKYPVLQDTPRRT